MHRRNFFGLVAAAAVTPLVGDSPPRIPAPQKIVYNNMVFHGKPYRLTQTQVYDASGKGVVLVGHTVRMTLGR